MASPQTPPPVRGNTPARAQNGSSTLPKQSGRMALSKVVTGRIEIPPAVVVYGPDGVGKTSFAASAPSPIFIGAEIGTAQLDVARFPQPTSFADILEAVEVLAAEQHGYQTLAIDSLDWAEPLVWRVVAERAGKQDIEDIGFKAGYVTAIGVWKELISALERLREKKRMTLIFIAHSQVKGFNNPEGEAFDRYEMALHNKASALWRQFVDAVLFARFEEHTYENKNKRVRGISTGARILCTERSAAFDAKNRYQLPPTLPLDWQTFIDAVRGAGGSNALQLVTSQIASELDRIGDEKIAQRANAALAKHAQNERELVKVLNWLKAQPSAETPSADSDSNNSNNSEVAQ